MTLKTGVMAAEILSFQSQEYITCEINVKNC